MTKNTKRKWSQPTVEIINTNVSTLGGNLSSHPQENELSNLGHDCKSYGANWVTYGHNGTPITCSAG